MPLSELTQKPLCVVRGCRDRSDLTSIAADDFYRFTTFYCTACYRRLLDGENLHVDANRLHIEHKHAGRGCLDD